MPKAKNASNRGAFTRIELMAVVAALFLFIFLLAPAYGRSMAGSNLAVCMSNLGQLTKAWQMFAEANGGDLPRNSFTGANSASSLTNSLWSYGWMSWDTAPDNTNTLNLTEGALGPYLNRNARVFKCPSDIHVSKVQQQRQMFERARSYSMSGFVGNSPTLYPSWNHYEKLQDIRDLSPDRLFVFLEEHPDSINDPIFWLSPDQLAWVDLPAARHAGGVSVSFADGHVEHKIWLEAITVQPVRVGIFSPPAPRAPALDYNWLKARATVRRLFY